MTVDVTKVVGYYYDGDTFCVECYKRNEALAVDMIIEREGVSEAEAHVEVKDNLEAHGGVIFAGDEFEFSLYCWECDDEVYINEEEEV